MVRSLTLLAFATALALICAAGCGSDETPIDVPPKDQPEAGDGKIYPAPDGVHVGETDACDALLKAQDAKIKALSCSITTRTCPALLRVVFVKPCLEYDDGSVKGCVDLYNMQTTCGGLADAIDACVVTSYPGTTTPGCT